ncbi:uncharacterized protein y4hQ-like, partial [Saccoglossus kowalevskii]|uniref:Uncharacterized protein LOC102805767 n=1 Tax=Saccoglossus kowalevskii TaxID=10224 RepID=A0ABM0MC33_SACKO
GISLHTLHKILLHIVGWNTQQYDYHSYCFVDQSDGAVFGPNKSTAVDSMLVFCNGYKFFDDKKLQLGLLLQKEGDRLLYIYDLGDQWEHLITVETILSEEVSTGACLVINGALHCPPEDSLGCWEASGNPSYQGLMDLLPRQKKWRGPFDSSVSLRAKILLKEGGMANNVTDGMLDPFKFEIEDVKDKLKKCITQSIRDMSGSKRTKNHGVAMCCNCGNPHNLHLCSGMLFNMYLLLTYIHL